MGFFDKRYKVQYITGIPGEHKAKKNYLLDIKNDYLKISQIFSNDIKILYPDIINVQVQTQGEIQKGLSVGKAAVGLVLLGPLGALIGAGMGSKRDNRVFFLTITHKDGGNKNHDVIVEANDAYEICSRIQEKISQK